MLQIRLSPSMRSLTISSSNGVLDLMKVRVAARHISYRTFFYAVVILAFLLPFVFILTAVVTLEGVDECSSFDCLGRRFGPRFLAGTDDSVRLVRELYKILNQVNSEETPEGLKLPESFSELISEIKSMHYDAKTFSIRLKAMVENLDRKVKKTKLSELLHRHFASSGIPKGIHCLSLRLTDEYSFNAHARKQLPPPELLPSLSDNSYHHFVLASDNILATSVVVTSAVRSSLKPEKIVFHVITDKKTYAGMHSWFALNPLTPAIIEVKGVHQFDWLTTENVPILEAIESHQGIRNHYHGNQISGASTEENPRLFASKLEARSPKYVSLLNHLRIYLPELFPNLSKVVFLDDDVVIQRDLSPLWDIDLGGKVNGAVETCKGDDSWVMSKHFRTYFNFSHPLIAQNLDPHDCAWAYGMNIFDLDAWRKTNIRDTYHFWLKENLNSNLTLWRLGTLPPALIAFKGHVHPISPSWHMLGLGYQEKTNLENLRQAAVPAWQGNRSFAAVVSGVDQAEAAPWKNRSVVEAGILPEEFVARRRSWGRQSIAVALRDGDVDAGTIRSKLMELSNIEWEVIRVATDLFLGVGSCEEGVALAVNTGSIQVSGCSLEIRRWPAKIGTFPPLPACRTWVAFEGLPIGLCDEEGVAFISRKFGRLIPGTLEFVSGSRIAVLASILVASPCDVPAAVVVGFDGEEIVIRCWVVLEERVGALRPPPPQSRLGLRRFRSEEGDDGAAGLSNLVRRPTLPAQANPAQVPVAAGGVRPADDSCAKRIPVEPEKGLDDLPANGLSSDPPFPPRRASPSCPPPAPRDVSSPRQPEASRVPPLTTAVSLRAPPAPSLDPPPSRPASFQEGKTEVGVDARRASRRQQHLSCGKCLARRRRARRRKQSRRSKLAPVEPPLSVVAPQPSEAIEDCQPTVVGSVGEYAGDKCDEQVDNSKEGVEVGREACGSDSGAGGNSNVDEIEDNALLPFALLSEDLFQDTPVSRIQASPEGAVRPQAQEVEILALPAPPVMSEDLQAALDLVEEAYKGEKEWPPDSESLSKGEVMDILAEVENFMESRAVGTAKLIGVADDGVDKGLKSSMLLIKRRWLAGIARKAKLDLADRRDL